MSFHDVICTGAALIVVLVCIVKSWKDSDADMAIIFMLALFSFILGMDVLALILSGAKT